MERGASWSCRWCHQATLDNNVVKENLDIRTGRLCVCMFVAVYSGSTEASLLSEISGEYVCLRVKHALMDKNKTLHADTLWAGEGGNVGLFPNNGSNPLRVTKPGVKGGRSIWYRHKDIPWPGLPSLRPSPAQTPKHPTADYPSHSRAPRGAHIKVVFPWDGWGCSTAANGRFTSLSCILPFLFMR